MADNLKQVSLDDKYDLSKNIIFLNANQAIVRLTMMQKERDHREGLNTAGFISGYRGSPIAGLDQQFMKAKSYYEPYNIKFEPGLNEDLAATSVWGSQQAEMRGDGKYDGVFGIWYGKGPGVDRCGDVFRHANMAGTSKNGGVLILMGDDHTAESSTMAHQSEFVLVDIMSPILNPAGIQELIDYGIYGWALSRYCGCWVGMKCVKDTIESTAIIDGSLDRIKINIPTDFDMPEDGLNIMAADDRLATEIRLHDYKRFAATAFARANNLDKIIIDGGQATKIGIITTGKSYLDVQQSLRDLKISKELAEKLGIRLLKIAMTWPLDPQIVKEFAQGLDYIFVIEEKRSLIETQIKEQLYGTVNPPIIVGKKDEHGNVLFPAKGVLDPNMIAIKLGQKLLEYNKHQLISERVKLIEKAQESLNHSKDIATRVPYFCAGCPHNSSTKVPKGGRGYAGIGCHWMVQFVPDRRTEGSTQMGGEGVNWVGEAPFSKREHVFQNLGDGTYNHSGSLAIRAAVAAGVNITFKILYNDTVAMTGGQPHEGKLSVPLIARQVAAESVEKIVVVSDEPEKYSRHYDLFPDGVTFHHRSKLELIQRELMHTKGVSILIYDQTCAAEKRRRRKRGSYPDPAKYVFINDDVCEGCGDCGSVSNCMAISPLETEFGRKRRIDQSVCNKDYSCLDGFCPSFITIHGGQIRKGLTIDFVNKDLSYFEKMPEPKLPDLNEAYGIIVTGIGGTGVVTIGALLGMAAYIENKGCGIIDMAGLSQKNGSVFSHVKIGKTQNDIKSIRIAAGRANLILGCDIVVAASSNILKTAAPERTRAVINTYKTMSAQFALDPEYDIPFSDLQKNINAAVGKNAEFVNSGAIANIIFGDTIAANLFTLGYAYQKGLIPVSSTAINKAIKLNGIAVDMNKQAFLWGRKMAYAPDKVIETISYNKSAKKDYSLQEIINNNKKFLTEYQNKEYALNYENTIQKIINAEQEIDKNSIKLSQTVAKSYFKLLAYKDEYEVARLYTKPEFKEKLTAQFTGDYKLRFYLAPPLLAKKDPVTGLPRKRQYGSWIMLVFKVLAKLKFLRGTMLDIFSYGHDRKLEKQLVKEYENHIYIIENNLSSQNMEVAINLARLPLSIKGYGYVKEENARNARKLANAMIKKLQHVDTDNNKKQQKDLENT